MIEVEVEVDLPGAPGTSRRRVAIDASTRLLRPVAALRGSSLTARLVAAPATPLTVGIEDGLPLAPTAPNAPAEVVASDGERVQVLRARDGDSGPFERLAMGDFDDWLVLPGRNRPILLVAPDWERQASLQVARNVGHGLRENAILARRDGDDVVVTFDLGSGRLGTAGLCSQVPPGSTETASCSAPSSARQRPRPSRS